MNDKSYQIPYDTGCKLFAMRMSRLDTPGMVHRRGELTKTFILIRGGIIWNSKQS